MFDVPSLRKLCSPDAEVLSDMVRINSFVEVGNEAADEIERLREALFDQGEELAAEIAKRQEREKSE